MEMGLSTRPRTHMSSQGRVHTSPHTQGKGLSRRMTSMASASCPIPMRFTYVGMSIPAGQVIWQGAGTSRTQSPVAQLWVSMWLWNTSRCSPSASRIDLAAAMAPGEAWS